MATSGLRLDDGEAALRGGYSGPVFKPGDSGASALVGRLVGAGGLMVMPPAGPKLTAEEIGVIRAWIDRGAKWPRSAETASTPNPRSDHWAFQPLRASRDGSIDDFIRARLTKEGIAPSPEAPRSVLLRRLSLDLTGLPPTPEELRAFLSDERPDAYERHVDRLLASPHYGEKWARQWLDLARYADSDGYEKDWVRPHAWRWRDWVINALNRDMPFDRFTVEQIAGDLLPDATVEQRVATGFHRNTLTNREGGVDNEQFRFEAVVDRASTVGTVWLGLTFGCAQCHDHKYDPISQKEFYQLYAFFDNAMEVDIDAPVGGEIGPWLRTRAEYQAKREALLKEYGVAPLQEDWERRVLAAAEQPGRWTDWDLAWDCVLKLTEAGDGARIVRKPPAARTPRERDILIDHFVRNYHFAVGRKTYNEARFDELDKKLRALKAEYPQLTQAYAIAEETEPRKTHLRVRGDYQTPGIPVVPGTPAVLPPLPAGAGATRLDLARWLVSRDNPLTARVVVNRIWQEYFGHGFVKTSEDFGTQGERPSHSELLDWLAASLMDDGWSLKALHRRIVLSETYRQSSHERPELKDQDPDNRLLARQARLRLPAESIRDTALAAGGLLDTRVGGPSVRPPQPAGVAELGYANSVKWTASDGRDQYRRGLYIHFQRTTPYPLLANFDAPKGTVTACRRERSNTPLQALNLLNDPVFLEAARALATQLTVNPGEFEERLRTAFLRVLSREPDSTETNRLRKYLLTQKAIFERDRTAAEALAPGAPDPVGTASWTALASVLLNLDEFVVRE
ncbi:MAG: PSD1 domain-containing protein [Bryobacterales bacterium]|nr:PSD1 domain-containing protein [Bryobacterales bacterium]